MEAGTVPRITSPRMPALTPRLIRLASDARLVAYAREGRAGAFEAIYDRHNRAILSFCRHLLGDQHEAEDAVQHTFMAAYSSLLSSQRPIHLRPWLFTIARNRCYSVLRAQRERPTAELDEAVTEGLPNEVQRRQDLRDLVSDLRRLPEEQRAAIVLAELDALSHADIAEVLEVPRDKVKALVFQARESLMASRSARDTPCHEIRVQLAGGRGGALRRSNLRRHLRDCEGCRAYRAAVQRQRGQFAALLPVAPTLLLKEGLVAAALGAGGAAAVGGSGLIASSALKTGFLKGLAAALVAGAGTVGTVVVSASDLPVRALASGSGAGSVTARAPGARHARSVPAQHHAVTSTGSYGAIPVAQLYARPTRQSAVSHPVTGTATHRHARVGAHRHHKLTAGRGARPDGARHHAAQPAHPGHPAHPAAPAPTGVPPVSINPGVTLGARGRAVRASASAQLGPARPGPSGPAGPAPRGHGWARQGSVPPGHVAVHASLAPRVHGPNQAGFPAPGHGPSHAGFLPNAHAFGRGAGPGHAHGRPRG